MHVVCSLWRLRRVELGVSGLGFRGFGFWVSGFRVNGLGV